MRRSIPLALLAAATTLAACSGSSRDPFASGAPANTATGDKGDNDTQGQGQTGGEFTNNARPDSGPTTGDVCAPDPANYEAGENQCDDDGDGTVDNEAGACDTSLAVDGDAERFAKALGLCQKISSKNDPKWGLISAKYLKGYNETAAPEAGQHGILPKFGNVVKPREGDALGILSTGWAREYDTDGNDTSKAFKKGGGMQGGGGLFGGLLGGGKLPPGYPKAAPNCPSISKANDIAVVRLEIKTPKNAQGLQFDFNFYSGEWPEYVCSAFNDGFIAYLKSSAFNGGSADNMSFDSKGAPVSVNNAFFDRCTPNTGIGCKSSLSLNPTGTAACPGGESELAGTGFEARGNYCGDKDSTGGGATGWLTSKAPVQGGEVITLEFYVWDSGDNAYNSSVLLDNFKWVPKPVVASTERPPK